MLFGDLLDVLRVQENAGFRDSRENVQPTVPSGGT